jgi:hypothetical protein
MLDCPQRLESVTTEKSSSRGLARLASAWRKPTPRSAEGEQLSSNYRSAITPDWRPGDSSLAHIGDPSRGARIASMPGAQLEDFGSGLTPVTQGWFVVNVRDAEWWNSARRGARCAFDNEYGDPPVEFAQLVINVTVLEPGETGLSTTPSRTRKRSSSFQGSVRCSSRARSDACGPGTFSTPLRGPSTPSWGRARSRV